MTLFLTNRYLTNSYYRESFHANCSERKFRTRYRISKVRCVSVGNCVWIYHFAGVFELLLMDELIHLHFIENLEVAEQQVVNRRRRTPEDPFLLSDEKFIKIFRLSKNLARYLIDLLTPFLTAPKRARDLDITTKVS